MTGHQDIIFTGKFKIDDRGRPPINNHSLLLFLFFRFLLPAKDLFLGKQKFDVKQLKVTNLYLTLNS